MKLVEDPFLVIDCYIRLWIDFPWHFYAVDILNDFAVPALCAKVAKIFWPDAFLRSITEFWQSSMIFYLWSWRTFNILRCLNLLMEATLCFMKIGYYPSFSSNYPPTFWSNSSFYRSELWRLFCMVLGNMDPSWRLSRIWQRDTCSEKGCGPS